MTHDFMKKFSTTTHFANESRFCLQFSQIKFSNNLSLISWFSVVFIFHSTFIFDTFLRLTAARCIDIFSKFFITSFDARLRLNENCFFCFQWTFEIVRIDISLKRYISLFIFRFNVYSIHLILNRVRIYFSQINIWHDEKCASENERNTEKKEQKNSNKWKITRAFTV